MEYYQIAAKWWADKLQNVTTSHYAPEAKNEVEVLTMVKAFEVANKIESSSRRIYSFETQLSQIIRDKVEKTGSCVLSVEYIPDAILEKVAVDNNVKTLLFPWKTKMHITSEKVRVTKFGKDTELIYPSEVDKE